jgi:hypothetical protein
MPNSTVVALLILLLLLSAVFAGVATYNVMTNSSPGATAYGVGCAVLFFGAFQAILADYLARPRSAP